MLKKTAQTSICNEHRLTYTHNWCQFHSVLLRYSNRYWTNTGSNRYATIRNVRSILVRGSMPPCRLRRRKFRKFDYEMVHSEVYLNKYVVSIEPISTPACPDCFQNITYINIENCFFAYFAFLFFIHFSRRTHGHNTCHADYSHNLFS